MTNIRHLLRPAAAVMIPIGFSAENLGESRPDWKQTATGRAVLVASPTPRQVCLLDMALGLSGIMRYDACTLDLIDVASHSSLAVGMAGLDIVRASQGADFYRQFVGEEPEDNPNIPALTGLNLVDIALHDGHEAYVGDITSPTSNALQILLPGFKSVMGALKRRWDVSIYEALRLPVIDPETEHGQDRQAVVHRYDMKALYAERDCRMLDPPSPWYQQDIYGDTVQEYPEAVLFLEEITGFSRSEKALRWLQDVDTALDAVDNDGGIDTREAHRMVADAMVRMRAFGESQGEL